MPRQVYPTPQAQSLLGLLEKQYASHRPSLARAMHFANIELQRDETWVYWIDSPAHLRAHVLLYSPLAVHFRPDAHQNKHWIINAAKPGFFDLGLGTTVVRDVQVDQNARELLEAIIEQAPPALRAAVARSLRCFERVLSRGENFFGWTPSLVHPGAHAVLFGPIAIHFEWSAAMQRLRIIDFNWLFMVWSRFARRL
jgi:hypothetical protein